MIKVQRRHRILGPLGLALMLLSALILALTAALLLPAVVLAEKPTSFSASGQVYVAGAPVPAPAGLSGRLRFLEEPVLGSITDGGGWSALTGASFSTVHDSNVSLDPNTGAVQGTMHGTFTLEKTGSIFTGTFEGTISGNLATGPVVDTGRWSGARGTGIFQGAKGRGTWTATLYPVYDTNGNLVTLAGPLTFAGTYQ